VERYSIFGYVVGQNELTKDFYLLKRRAIENNLETFYWKRTCAVLVKLIPMVHIILDLLKIPEKGEGEVEKEEKEEGQGEGSLRRKKITSKELLKSSWLFVKEKMLAEAAGGAGAGGEGGKGKCSEDQQQQQLNIGKKQIFLRASYYEYLENLLYRANSMVARIVQSNWRYKTHQYLKSLHLSSSKERIVHHLVHMFRSLQTSRTYTRAFFGQLISLQRRFRVYFHARRFRLGRFLSTWISSHFRGGKARATARARRHLMARRIQMTWRGYHHRARYQQERVAICQVQRWYRTVRLRLVEKREGERYRRGIQALGKLQAMRRGQRVRVHYQSLLLEKVTPPPSSSSSSSSSSHLTSPSSRQIERRRALQLLFPTHFQALLNPKTLHDFTQSFFDQMERGQGPSSSGSGSAVEIVEVVDEATSPGSVMRGDATAVDKGTSPMTPPPPGDEDAEGEQGQEQGELQMTIVTPPVVLYQKESYESWTPGSSPAKDTRSPLHGSSEEGESPSRIAALESEILALRSHIDRLERELETKSKNRFMCF
jgi:hypothetical protein